MSIRLIGALVVSAMFAGEVAAQLPFYFRARETKRPRVNPPTDPVNGGETGDVCGTIAGIECSAANTFCKFPAGECNVSDNQGVCTPIPEACPEIYDPVCACDGLTYDNECFADAAQVSIDHAGACNGDVCGGFMGLPCGPGEYCKHPIGECHISDNFGVCVGMPIACPDVWDPVCGCDGMTYGNECEAEAVGVSLAHEGACESICGTAIGLQCADGEFCKYPIGTCDIVDNAGVCMPIPEGCPDVWDPVCGCDGVTYGNKCEAHAVGASLAHDGECENICGTILGIPCEDGQFCKFPIGECHISDNQGVCVDIPAGCDAVWDPVCGCDGVTYGNKCEAHAAGASIDHEGVCFDACGGLLGEPCDEGEFCQLPTGTCDIADLQGVCIPVPEACPEIYDPVCGCDDVTYGNACEAVIAGVQIDHAGPCETICGTAIGLQCTDGEFCKYPIGTCDIVDNAGVCVAIPQGCPDVWDPVCGCDGMTYGNACEADAVGVSLAYEGECENVCGGFAGIPCEDDEFCKYPIGECHISDNLGSCVEIPQACPDVWDPVCGCDGVTYGNVCEADAAGMSLDHEGPCQQSCGGFTGEPCPVGEVCILPPGHCDGADVPGECVPIPDACPAIWDPVCGCDGVTYSNVCEAIAAGTQIDHEGSCSEMCGGFIGIPCNDGEYCMFPPGTCHVSDHFGECVEIPGGCPDVWDPVCGCDGVTYGNECDARAALAQIAHEGECNEVCGGLLGGPCDEGEFCKFPAGECDIADNAGECVEIPLACPDVWDPVCGCDGVTYGNVCEADAAQAQIDHEGDCGTSCGTILGIPCGAGEFCKFPLGECHIADNEGACTVIPEACPNVWDPVCGCDGVTYSNVCDADAAGVSLAHEGECVDPPSVTTAGSHYITITAAPGTQAVALLVESPCGMSYVSDSGGLGAAPLFQTPAEWGEVMVDSVEPGTTYFVRAEISGMISSAASASTNAWGDINASGAVDLFDIVCVFDAFSGAGACSQTAADIGGCVPNGQVDIDDILAVLSAFAGEPYACPACP